MTSTRQLDYGVPRDAMREDVRVYAENMATEHLRDLGLLSEATTDVSGRQRPSSTERREDLSPESPVRAGVLDESGDHAHRVGQGVGRSTETVQQVCATTSRGR